MSIANVKFQMESNYVGMAFGKVAQVVKYSDFTDDGDDIYGDLVLNKQVPAGSLVIATKVTVKTGFTGDTTAVLSVDDTPDGTDWTGGGTINILAAGRNLMAETNNGLVVVDTDVCLTITGASNFTLITAGEMLVEVYYLSTNVELTDSQPTEVNLSA